VEKAPFVSILIPTLNSQRVLGKCLRSIKNQDYPSGKLEIIIADGGSTDRTIQIAKKYGAEIYPNKLKTGESGKAIALRKAKGELVALIDSDNVLPGKDWLQKMTQPFLDKDILGAEPLWFTYRKKDNFINRYCALLGANDPYAFFVGNYDKLSVLSGKWTGIKIKQEDKGDYSEVFFRKPPFPTVGANGTVWRRKELLRAVGKSDYLFDTDIPYMVAKQRKGFYFAKVKVGIVHLYCRTWRDFYRKQKRRARDFFSLLNKKERVVTYQRQTGKQVGFILSNLLILPLLFQTVKGLIKKPDPAWFFHPVASLITLWVYSAETLQGFVRKPQMERENWCQ